MDKKSIIPIKQDITGMRFGNLTVVREVEKVNGKIKILTICTCGNERILIKQALTSGGAYACKECSFNNKIKHHKCDSKEYKVWSQMIQRCSNPNSKNFDRYGGRGVSVCDRWRYSFAAFYDDMGDSNGLTIERINSNGNYEPLNCKWATTKEQSRNKKSNINLTYNGVTKIFQDWCNEYNLHRNVLRRRLDLGWSMHDCLNVPVKRKKKNGIKI